LRARRPEFDRNSDHWTPRVFRLVLDPDLIAGKHHTAGKAAHGTVDLQS